MSARGAPAASPAAPAPPDMPDLSHLTEEERKIILSVMERQKKEEEKEQSMLKLLLIRARTVRLWWVGLAVGAIFAKNPISCRLPEITTRLSACCRIGQTLNINATPSAAIFARLQLPWEPRAVFSAPRRCPVLAVAVRMCVFSMSAACVCVCC
ncbi:Regulating synaptic membrane exocytosis protein 2 [Labeo rohita]|uniref:Regulating synaptic membrane exocytosis protein 2 n=1 Tax=Labeo rohita TaxID=84645 RepID=A0ABQ8LPH8_LABRO|nr:Regulating synaptic membrane exocytosis protein 2 [Labeo rohita]